jgi:hypothetical protein
VAEIKKCFEASASSSAFSHDTAKKTRDGDVPLAFLAHDP